jgi:tetratricopeptide (TPR) repeat protein
VSANVAVATLALLALFGGKDLGAATVAVTLTDEEGHQVARVIPKAEFRKRLAIFYFDPETGDSLAHTLAYGIPEALAVDLWQDLFVDLRMPGNFRDRLRERGYAALNGVPLALAREVAREQFREQFVTGTVRTEGGEIVVTMAVHETATGERVTESVVRGADPLAIADQLATDIRGTVEVPEDYAGRTPDLPTTDLLTSSRAAFLDFARAQEALTVHDDWARSAALLEEAVARDPAFAYAQYVLFAVYVFQNRAQDGRAPLQAAVDQVYRLPERMQNLVKANYYEMRREPEKMYAVIEMNAELFPTDVVAQQALVQVQMVRGRRREAIATAERILRVDPNQHDYLRAIAELYQALGEYDQALTYYRRYTDLNPDDRRGLRGLGGLRETQGDHEGAREAYRRVALLHPGDVTAALDLADLDLAVGEFDRAREAYAQALRDARTAPDSVAAYTGLARYHGFRGRVGESLRFREAAWALQARIGPPIQLMLERLRGLGDYVAGGDTARALALLDEWGGQLQPPFDAFRPLGDLDVALELEQPARIDSAAAALEDVIAEFSYEFLRPNLVFARGQAHYLRGEFREAMADWERERELSPGDPTVPRQLGQAYRGLGDFRKAEDALHAARRIRPADPRTLYEIALLDDARGRRGAAIENLRRALEIWVDADPTYKWARRAREKLAELERGR